MGCGKTTVGRVLADMMSLEYTDMDAYIEKKSGMSIPQIFAEKGEDAFRRMETKAVAELGKAGGIIACGGGAMLKEINAKTAAEYGTVVYIDVDFESCYGRISGDRNRPIVTSNTKEELNLIYDGRIPVYKENSALTVDGSGSPEEIAERIISLINIVK